MMRRLLIALMALVMIGGVAGVAMAQNDSAAISAAQDWFRSTVSVLASRTSTPTGR